MELIYEIGVVAGLSSIAETICSIFRSPVGEYWVCDQLPPVAPGTSKDSDHLKQKLKL